LVELTTMFCSLFLVQKSLNKKRCKLIQISNIFSGLWSDDDHRSGQSWREIIFFIHAIRISSIFRGCQVSTLFICSCLLACSYGKMTRIHTAQSLHREDFLNFSSPYLGY
jgi:hypothetical protein